MASSSRDTSCSSPSPFIDTATDCAICLSPLSDDQVITLQCGHVWHLDCIKTQLAKADLSSSSRLLFSGCRCAKCNAFCDHPALSSAVRASAALSARVDALITDQLRVDGVDAHGADALAIGRARYAFYQCSICAEPYFGGTVDCADADDDILPTADRMCPTCTPHTSGVCMQNTHAAFHVWKCRYCCRSASYLCEGTTHYCEDCHKRGGKKKRGEVLSGIECPGVQCETTLPAGKEKHTNGPSYLSEQILRCSICASDPEGVGASVDEGRVSENMVFNPSADFGARGWAMGRLPGRERWMGRSGGDAWAVERSGTPFGRNQFNFVSSYSWAIMSQAVDLRTHLTDPSRACIEVSARYMGRWDCPSVFVLKADLYACEHTGFLGRTNYRKIGEHLSEVLEAPVDFWEIAKCVFEPIEGAAVVVVTVIGKDQRIWSGDYGSKVTNISVRVRFDDSSAIEEDLIAQPVAVVEPALSDMTLFSDDVVARVDGGRASENMGRVSENMVFNPSADLGARGWAMGRLAGRERWMGRSGGDAWAVERSGTPFGRNQFNFVSSYSWAIMSQAVDLRTHLTDPSRACIEVSARYMGRWDCPSVFVLKAELYTCERTGFLGRTNYRKIGEHLSEVLEAPVDFWEIAKCVFEPIEGAAVVVVTVIGKDQRFWRGDYGSKVTNISVRVRFDDSSATEEDLIAQPVAAVEPTLSDMTLFSNVAWEENVRRLMR